MRDGPRARRAGARPGSPGRGRRGPAGLPRGWDRGPEGRAPSRFVASAPLGPRVRDFRGINPKSFDGNGNYALGIKEQFVFPEIEYDNVDSARGMDIIFVTSAKTDGEAKELLNGFDFPFNQQ